MMAKTRKAWHAVMRKNGLNDSKLQYTAKKS